MQKVNLFTHKFKINEKSHSLHIVHIDFKLTVTLVYATCENGPLSSPRWDCLKYSCRERVENEHHVTIYVLFTGITLIMCTIYSK